MDTYTYARQVVGTTELQREGARALVARSLLAWVAQVFVCSCINACMYQFMHIGMKAGLESAHTIAKHA